MAVKRVPTNHWNKVDAGDLIAQREAFTTHGALKADWVTYRVDSGYLQGDDLEAWNALWSDIRALGVIDPDREPEHVYVVRSYGTPIAWWWAGAETGDSGWYQVWTKFSRTTSGHQTVTAYGVQRSGD